MIIKNILLLILSSIASFGQVVDVNFKSVLLTKENSKGKPIIEFRYKIDSLKIDDANQARIFNATSYFEDGSVENLNDSEYYDFGNATPSMSISFLRPSRMPDKIKYIEGKVTYFTPNYKNGDLKLLNNLNSKINSQVLSEQRCSIYLLDIQELAKYKKLTKWNRNKAICKLINLEKASPSFKRMIDKFYSSINFSTGISSQTTFFIFNPEKDFFALRNIDNTGKLINRGYSSSKDIWSYYQLFNSSSNEDVVVIFQTKNSTKTFNFREKNVEVINFN